jgi:hypothetical protein
MAVDATVHHAYLDTLNMRIRNRAEVQACCHDAVLSKASQHNAACTLKTVTLLGPLLNLSSSSKCIDFLIITLAH